MGRLTIQVLDSVHGSPAEGMTVTLYSMEGGELVRLKTVRLNRTGGTDAPLLAGPDMLVGRYRLVLGVAEYFRTRGVRLAEPAFLDEVPLDIGIAEVGVLYHLSLLISPWSYSMYRGR